MPTELSTDGKKCSVQAWLDKFVSIAPESIRDSLILRGSENFGAQLDPIKNKIDSDILRFFGSSTESSQVYITEIKARPNFSRSHSRSAGVWAYSPQAQLLGIDIEELIRLKPEVIERICKSDEIENCPDTIFLWSAKEAAFKALSRLFSLTVVAEVRWQTMTQPETTHWSQIETDLFKFKTKLRNPHAGSQSETEWTGYLTRSSAFTLALVIG